jgi:cellulose synthase/poly-beta-1,6-N-acetylglucosamine synthase-like glycosyltransferase
VNEGHTKQPRVSVIIPNLNSLIIDQTLEAVRAQDFDLSRVEVLAVGLDEPELVRTDELVRLISTGVPAAPAVARNIGMREAKGDLLCFTDADCIPEPEWLIRLTTPFGDGGVHVVGGGVTFEARNYWALCDNLSWFHDYLVSSRQGQREQLPSLNLCVRRSVIDRVGLFNESYPRAAGEDAEWTTRMRQAGYTLHLVRDAVVHHCPTRVRFKALWNHAFIYGQHSVKVNPEFTDFLGVAAVLRKWWSVLLLAPFLALAVTGKIFAGDTKLLGYWYAAPGIFLSKIAWCLGASRTLYRIGRNA